MHCASSSFKNYVYSTQICVGALAPTWWEVLHFEKTNLLYFGPLGVITLCYRGTEGCVVWELQKEMMRRDPCGPSSPPVLPHSSQFWLKSKLREWEGPAIYRLSIPAVYVHCTCVLYTVRVYCTLYVYSTCTVRVRVQCTVHCRCHLPATRHPEYLLPRMYSIWK